jgi:FkbM family methyltransferase
VRGGLGVIDWKFLFERHVLGQHWGWNDKRKYERNVQKAVKRIHGGLFVDIGARQLFYANMLAKNFSQVIAFEPNRNVKIPKHPSNVLVLNQAVSDKTGYSTFYCQNNGGADGLIENFDYHVPDGRGYADSQTGPFHATIDSFDVRTQTYDHAINQIADLVIVDVEGAEFMVIDGMSEHLPRNIVIELHDSRREIELIQKMSDKGYKTKKLDVIHWLFTI